MEIALLVTALRSRRSALMVIIFSLPFARVMPAVPIPLLNYQSLLVVVGLLAMARDQRREGDHPIRVHHWLPVGILSLLLTVSYLQTIFAFSPPIFPGLWKPHQVNMEYKATILCVVLYFLASSAIRSREDLVAVVRAGAAGIILEAGYTTFEYLVLSPGRATGHLAEPNNTGLYMACSFNLLLALLTLLPRGYRYRRYLAAGLVLCLLSLVGSFSRGAWVACLLGFAVFSALASRKLLVAGLAVLALTSLWVPQAVQSRLDTTFIEEDELFIRFREGRAAEESAIIGAIHGRLERNAEARGEQGGKTRLDPSLQERIIVWSAAFSMMADHPLGLGYGVFPFYVHQYSQVVPFKAAHNMFLRLGAEVGLPALTLFLYLVGAMMRDCFLAWKRGLTPELRALGAGMLAYLVTLVAGALFIDVFFQVEVNGQFWIFMAALTRAPALLAPRKEESPEDEIVKEGSVPLYELVR
jgi:O-antigen ligase